MERILSIEDFHHLCFELRYFPDKFFEYQRESISTFDFLLSKIKNRITKIKTNYRTPILIRRRIARGDF